MNAEPATRSKPTPISQRSILVNATGTRPRATMPPLVLTPALKVSSRRPRSLPHGGRELVEDRPTGGAKTPIRRRRLENSSGHASPVPRPRR
jgi:hypothetical protein